jgi:ATP-binding cassette subfamily C protein
MLQIYDRVLTSHSVPTLVVLSLLAIGLYLSQGVLDVIRGHILALVASRIEERQAPDAHDALLRLPLFGASTTDATLPIRDIEVVRSFVSSQGPIAIFDLPWMPVYLAFVYFLHPWLGLLATGGVIVLVVISLLADRLTRDLSARSARAQIERSAIADANARNAEVLKAMGMGVRAAQRFHASNGIYLKLQARLSEVGSALSGISRVLRMILQSAVLGLGAYLTIRGQVTAGAIIAASIAAARALAPIDLAIAHWKGLVAARQSFSRLKATLAALPELISPLQLPAPSRTVAAESIVVPVPGTQRLILNGVNFELKAGQGLGVIGPSAAGKSTLARAVTGVWPLLRGAVRIDGAALDRWGAEELGRHIGYLPQSIELFSGTIAENISRFEDAPQSGAIIAAAQAAGVHEMILRLPEGYETSLGAGGAALSAGQRQRIALARALYGAPFLLVLDEPNSNLDSEGEAALASAILGVRRRGGIVIVIAHRPSALSAVDLVAMMVNGQITALGAKDEILRKVLQQSGSQTS